MKRHLVLVYWLLLLVSTLAIGGVAFYLLQRENARLREAAANAIEDTGMKINADLEALVSDSKLASMDALGRLPEDNNLAFNLLNWKNNYHYVHSVVLFRPDRGLELPLSQTTERESIEPFLHKPDGSWVWGGAESPTTRVTITSVTGHTVPSAGNEAGPTDSSNNYSRMSADRQKIREDADAAANAATKSAASGSNLALNGGLGANGLRVGAGATAVGLPGVELGNQAINGNLTQSVVPAGLDGNLVQGPALGQQQAELVISQQTIELISTNTSSTLETPEKGWALVGAANDLHWFGWMRLTPGGPVRGMVLSWSALTAPLANNLYAENIDPNAGYVLRNPAGKVVAAYYGSGRLVAGGTGKAPVESVQAVPLVPPYKKLSLSGTSMPGWTLTVYYDPGAALSNGLMALSTILVTLLVIFVLVGGTLLLREAKREAYEAARKTNFVSNVSHELKTPLTTIRMYAELLGEGRVRDENKQRNYLSTIIGESQRLTRLVNNVLDFSRLEQGRKQYHPDDLALAQVIENVIEAQRPRLEAAGFEIETEFPYGRDVRVHADRDALEQVLINLMDNAMKYAANGHWLGIKVGVTGGSARIAVSDRGPGVPPEHREKIFEMFHRVDDSITAKLPGAGLGLSIARRLLRDQEGDLRYEPNEPQGSTFVAELPLASAISAAKIS